MAELRRRIVVPVYEVEQINKLLETEPEDEEECFGEDETWYYTAGFGNGIEADIKICGVQYEEGESNLPWTEGVLFEDGYEICCTEPSDGLFGEWEFEADGNTYIVDVVEGHEISGSETRQQVVVPKEEAVKINRTLSEGLKDGEKLETYVAVFDDGVKMHIDVCGREHAQAALSLGDSGVCLSQDSNAFFGIWPLEYNGVTYITEVIEGE